MSKLPNPSNKCGVLSVAQYYSYLGLTEKFDSLPTEKDYALKILRDIDTSKAAGIDRLPGRLLKGGADVLAKPVIDICNISISLNKFPRAFELAKNKSIFIICRKPNVSNCRPLLTANTFGGKVKHELRVTSYKFKSTSCEFNFTSYEFKFTSYEFKSTSYNFKSTSYEFKSTSYVLKSTS